MFTSGGVAIWTLVLCGFFNSIMFPNIFTLGIAGLGPMTSKGSGLIMTAVVGGAVVPLLLGALADKMGIQHCVCHPDDLLPLHCLLRAVGIQAYAQNHCVNIFIDCESKGSSAVSEEPLLFQARSARHSGCICLSTITIPSAVSTLINANRNALA